MEKKKTPLGNQNKISNKDIVLTSNGSGTENFDVKVDLLAENPQLQQLVTSSQQNDPMNVPRVYLESLPLYFRDNRPSHRHAIFLDLIV